MRLPLASVVALASLAPQIRAQGEVGPLSLPRNADLTAEVAEPVARYALPTGPFGADGVPTVALDGALLQQAWRIEAPDLATAQIAAPLREQLEAMGYDILFDCETDACGGFDFRFGTDVLPPPAMYVDLGDFRFISARRPTGEAASLMISQSPFAGFVQIVRLSPEGAAPPVASETERISLRPPGAIALAGLPEDFGDALEAEGRVVLTDLDFDTGSSDLGPGPYASLEALAAYLRANPARQVALVGHTDAVGALDGNIVLSRRRAASVVARLTGSFGIPSAQLAAEGMGYLAPIATNLTPEGRETNRRVEVIVTSTP